MGLEYEFLGGRVYPATEVMCYCVTGPPGFLVAADPEPFVLVDIATRILDPVL